MALMLNMDTFTFHYASTLSVERILFRCPKIVFTFHYASTLSEVLIHQTMYLLVNLHSTMLLLYHALQLIPDSDSISFTFHYASTLSRPPFPLLLSPIQVYFLSTPFLHSSPLKNLPPPTLQNMNFP